MQVTIATKNGGAVISNPPAVFFDEKEKKVDIFFTMIHVVNINYESIKITDTEITVVCKSELEKLNIAINPIPQQDIVAAAMAQQGLIRNLGGRG